MPDPINPAVTRAVVKAVDRLTTQVGRIADALTTPVVEYEVTADDNATTPVIPDFTSPIAGRVEVRQPCPYCGDRQMIPRHQFDEHVARLHPDVRAGGPDTPVPDAEALDSDEEQTLQWARRESLLVLLTRLQRGRTLTEDEARTLREHVEHEMREADTARSVATGNKRHVQLMYAELERANAVTAETKKLLERRTTTLRRRAEIAETELRTLRSGIRSLGGDPTTIQNLWAQISLRNRQWAEAKRERDEAQAAIDRVRALLDTHLGPLATAAVRRALDGTEQPDA